jgi:ABC-type dipeptide/oligopeptide/nickel transport system permease subunit
MHDTMEKKRNGAVSSNGDRDNVAKVPEKHVGYWGSAWRRFKLNKLAFISLIFSGFLILVSIITPWITPYQYSEAHYENTFESPSLKFIFGTDDLGRDMYTRILYSVRNELIVAFSSQAITLVIGLLLGAIAGFKGGVVDSFIMRIVDVMFAFPMYLFCVILVTVMDRGLFPVIIAIGVTNWAGLARLVRGQILMLKQAEFVEAARALGAKDRHIITKYLIPNTFGPIIVSFMMGVPNAMIIEGGLSFLGMGLRPPMPSFGNLLNSGNSAMLGIPHLLIFPVIFFALMLIAFNFVGDGLRDALNPKSEV